MIHRFVFVLCRIFDFQKIFFLYFLMNGLEFLSRVGSIRKSIKKSIFYKKIISLTITVLLLLPKTCFFFFFNELITPKLNGQFFVERSR